MQLSRVDRDKLGGPALPVKVEKIHFIEVVPIQPIDNAG
jgi:hypothetical protein